MGSLRIEENKKSVRLSNCPLAKCGCMCAFLASKCSYSNGVDNVSGSIALEKYSEKTRFSFTITLVFLRRGLEDSLYLLQKFSDCRHP